MRVKAWLAAAWREPLVQFGVLGALVYLASQSISGESSRIPAWRLEDSRAKMSRLLDGGGAPEAVRLEADLRVISDELLYREALRQGLDEDDPVIRQHLAGKLLTLTEEAALAGREPTAAEELALFESLRARWAEPARVSFCHVFASRPVVARPAPEATGGHEAPCDGGGGEAFPLGPFVGPHTEAELAERFGEPFARQVFEAPLGRWSAPIASRYGVHRVRVTARLPAIEPRFEERRDAVRLAWTQQERARARAELLRTLARRDRPEVAPGAPAELHEAVAQAVAQLQR